MLVLVMRLKKSLHIKGTDMDLEKECIILCSGHYLSEIIPEEFFDWDEQKQDQFIADNTWEPMEYMLPKDVWDAIISAATVTRQWYERRHV